MNAAPLTPSRLDRLFPWIVGAVACGLAVWQLLVFWQHAERLWYWSTHDRNFHYFLGLGIASDIRSFDLARLGYDLDSGGRTWGLVHALMVAAIELIAGGDYRWAVLPSLCGWVASALLMFLTARRLVPRAGNAAGIVATLFFLASPAYRAYSTDIMLESLGATLSLLILLRYLIAVQDDVPNSGRWLGLALTVLFLLKYNYWLLVFAGVVIGEFCRQPGFYLAAGQRFARALADRNLWLAQLKRPLTYVMLALAAWIGFVFANRGKPVVLFGETHVFYSAENPVSVLYWLLFVRFFRWYRREGRLEVATWDMRLQQAFRWHPLVVAWYFLWPKRLSYFVWFLSPFNNDSQRRATGGFLHGAPVYLEGLRDDYHAAPWMLTLAVALAAVALLLWRRTRPGAGAVLAFAAVAAVLTFQHPMWKYRFMHSWADSLWLLSAAGFALAADLVAGLLKTRSCWLAAPGIAAIACFFVPTMRPPGIAQEGGIRFDRPSFLVLHETYLPNLYDSKEAAIVCNVPIWFSIDWTIIEKYGRRIRWTNHIDDYSRGHESDPGVLERWAAESRADTIVLVDIAKKSHFYDLTGDTIELAPLRRFLEARPEIYQLVDTWTLPEGTVITRWTRAQPSP